MLQQIKVGLSGIRALGYELGNRMMAEETRFSHARLTQRCVLIIENGGVHSIAWLVSLRSTNERERRRTYSISSHARFD